MTMMLIGRIEKEGALWAAEAEAIGAYTQGHSKQEAFEMLAELVELKVDHEGFKAIVTEEYTEPDGAIVVHVTGSEPHRIAAAVLKHQREMSKLTQAEAAKRSGNVDDKGRGRQSDWAVYERGERDPSLGKYIELLAAVAPDLTLAVVPKKVSR